MKTIAKKVMCLFLAAVMVMGICILPSMTENVFADGENGVYTFDTSKSENPNGQWEYGYFAKGKNDGFTPYSTYVESNGKWRVENDDFNNGAITSNTASYSTVTAGYEPAVIFTAPKEGTVKLDLSVIPPIRGNGNDSTGLTEGSFDGIGYKLERYSSDGSFVEKLYPNGDEEWRELDRGIPLDEQTLYAYVNNGDKIRLRFNALKTQWGDNFKISNYKISYIEENVVFEKAEKFIVYYDPNRDYAFRDLNNVVLSAKKLSENAEIIGYTSSDESILSSVTDADGTANTTGKFVVKAANCTNQNVKILSDPIKLTCKYRDVPDGEEKSVTQDIYIRVSNYIKTSVDGMETYKWKNWDSEYSTQAWSDNGPIWYYGLAYPRGKAANEVKYGFDYFKYIGSQNNKSFRLSLASDDYANLQISAYTFRNNLSNGGDMVIAFKAPKSGTVKVSAKHYPTAYGNDGMRYAIRKGNQKLYPTGDEEWKTIAQNETDNYGSFVTNVEKDEYIYFVANINKNNYSDEYTWTPQVQYFAEGSFENMSFNKDKYFLTYCSESDDAALNNNNQTDITVTVPQTEYFEGKNIVYSTSDTSKLEWTGEGGTFNIKGGTETDKPVEVTASTEDGLLSVSTKVYIFEQTLTDANNSDCYPLYTGKTAATQGPVWFAKYATPMKAENVADVVYTDLKSDIRSDGTTILWGGTEDLYTYGNIRKNEAGTSHSGANGDITLAFKAPRSGKIRIGSQKPFEGSAKSSGFNYRISKNSSPVYPSDGSWAYYNGYTSAENKQEFVESVDTTVSQGDFIYITINNNGSNSNGGFRYVPTVTYIDEDENPFNLTVGKKLAIGNVSADGGADNNDTLQRALSLDEPQARIIVTEGENGEQSMESLADAEDYTKPGEFKSFPSSAENGSATIDIKLTGDSTGKTLDNLDVIMQSKLKTSWQEQSGLHYSLEFQYSTTANPTEFTTFYKTSSSRVPLNNTSYPLIRIKDIDGKISDIDTIRIISKTKNGSGASIGEIDLNTKTDSTEVAEAKQKKLNELTVDSIYNDNMMFQQNKPIVITGKGGVGKVTAKLTKNGESTVNKSGTADGSQNGWEIELDPMDGGFDEYTLTISDANSTKSFTGIVIGELWLAAGQSNMMFWEYESSSYETDKSDAENYNIRYFGQDVISAVDKRDDVCNGKWTLANSADSIGNAYATAYQFAKNYYNYLDKKVPVGLIQVANGSSGIQCFMPKELLVGELAALDNSDTRDPYLDSTNSPVWRTKATGLYNGMLNPINVRIGGVIWYQAENNAGNPELYKKAEPIFINMLRQKFEDASLPFILTQLPSYGLESGWERMRDVQMQNALADPNCGIAVMIDTGDKDNIHPIDKTKVGERLARVAAGKFKGAEVEYTGPMLSGIKADDSKLVLSFESAGGLYVKGDSLNCFELSSDGVTYVKADARLNGNTVEVSANGVDKPKYVRYAYASYAENPNLYNGADLPAAPFDASVSAYTDWTVEFSDGKAKVSNTVINTDSFALNQKLIMAVYDNNDKLIDIKIAPFDIIYKESAELNETIGLGDNASYIKVMQWNNTNDLTPVKNVQKADIRE